MDYYTTISFPAFLKSDSTRTRAPMRRRFRAPVAWVRVEVPTLTTMRRLFSIILIKNLSLSKKIYQKALFNQQVLYYNKGSGR